MKGNGDTNCSWSIWNGLQKLVKKIGGTRDLRKNRDYPDSRIAKIDEDTEMSPGDLRKLAVAQAPVKDLQLMLV